MSHVETQDKNENDKQNEIRRKLYAWGEITRKIYRHEATNTTIAHNNNCARETYTLIGLEISGEYLDMSVMNSMGVLYWTAT